MKHELLAEALSIIQRLQDDLLECLQSYAMTEAAQVQIMGLLKEATLFRRKANVHADGRGASPRTVRRDVGADRRTP